MSIEVLRRELDQTSNTLNVVILSISEATSALDEYDNLRRTLEKIRNLSERIRELETRLKEAEKKEREMGEEGRRMTDEIERLSTAVEWVLKEIQEKIAAERGLATTTIKDYFRMYRRISVGFYDKDVAMLQAALSHAEQDGGKDRAGDTKRERMV